MSTPFRDHLTALSKAMGVCPDWAFLRMHWDRKKKEYVRTEFSEDGKTWKPGDFEGNVISIRYIGGPRNGEVES